MDEGNFEPRDGAPSNMLGRLHVDEERVDSAPTAAAARRRNKHRKGQSKWSEWSGWVWSNEYNREYRYRHDDQFGKDDDAYEYEYRDQMTPLKYSEPLDLEYKLHPSRDFKFGKVFKILWAEPSGSVGNFTPRSSAATSEGAVYSSIRRFVIIKAQMGHSLCLPILTYGGQGTLKFGVKASSHAVIYTGNKAMGNPGEEGLKKSIKVTLLHPRESLDLSSRLNYAKVYTVEHNVKVCFIGRIHSKSENQFVSDFNSINSIDEQTHMPPPPYLGTGPPSAVSITQPEIYISESKDLAHKPLHSDFKKANRALLKIGRVFSTPYTEIAGPSVPDDNEITIDPYGNRLHTKIRRAIVVRDMPSHCVCVPINTYGGRDNKYFAKPQDQYRLFSANGTWDKSRIDRKELPLVVEAADADINYTLASVDFTRTFYVQHYALVKKIGRIDKLGLPLLEEGLRRAWDLPVAIEENNPPHISMFSPTHNKWYGLVVSIDAGSRDNFISQRSVDRLRLSSAPDEDAWEHVNRHGLHPAPAERLIVTATFRFSGSQNTHESQFYVTENVTSDVCFGKTSLSGGLCNVPEIFNLLNASEAHTEMDMEDVTETETAYPYTYDGTETADGYTYEGTETTVPYAYEGTRNVVPSYDGTATEALQSYDESLYDA